MPHDTLIEAVAGLSICGAGQSGGGAIANTCSSLRAASPGVTGRLTNMAQPEVAAAPATRANIGGKSDLRVFMARHNNMASPQKGPGAAMPMRRESGSMRACHDCV